MKAEKPAKKGKKAEALEEKKSAEKPGKKGIALRPIDFATLRGTGGGGGVLYSLYFLQTFHSLALLSSSSVSICLSICLCLPLSASVGLCLPRSASPISPPHP